ncbi:ubiquitin-conjugating enzyme E2 J1-like [Dreissena polymorpha]|uniref:UBC core domain-containing protein n=1 Tax=Dreissena polymorpha TaxID=45954 RepID=A0A9D4HWI9_DREPO|nr:ubiquitin-conjugating enzyme E2 J1-like [Dreissena polymorpha]KAH3735459.1 hypothetical protein DPMN_041990 [Dreissena polymorpha]
MQGLYSMRSPAVKRLMKEAHELREPTEQFACSPLEDNLFEWHFTIRGPADSEFEGGLYHGRIILPPEYPMKPPSIIIMTPNGRFEINKKICLSISGHHPESWQPSWSLRTAMLAIIGFMPTHGAGALGSLDYSPDERKALAKRSQDYKCPTCGCINNILKPVTEESKKTTQEARELAAQIDFKDEKEKNAALQSSRAQCNATDNSTADNTDMNAASASYNDAAQAQQLPPQFPPPFGQFPFGMPFPPPPFMFQQMMAQNLPGSTNLSQVPRFPLPFASPFFPPVQPSMMAPGTFSYPMMPGMQVPPWQHGVPSPPPSGEQLGEVTSQRNTREVNTVTPTEEQSTAGQISSAENNESNTTETQNSTQSAQETNSNSPRSAHQSGLRHRNTARQRSADHTSAEIQAGPRRRTYTSSRSGDVALLTFCLFVIAVIFLLLLRRLQMMNIITIW